MTITQTFDLYLHDAIRMHVPDGIQFEQMK